MARAVKPRADTRHTILDAAFDLMTREGYHAVSMRDVAAAVGIAAPSLYNHFGGKDALVEAVILDRHPFTRIAPRLETLAEDTPEDLLRAFAHLAIGEVKATPGLFDLMMIELVELRGVHLPQILPSLLAGLNGFLTRLYDMAGARLPTDRAVLMQGLSGVLLSHLVSSRHLDPPPDLDAALDLFLHGALDEARS